MTLVGTQAAVWPSAREPLARLHRWARAVAPEAKIAALGGLVVASVATPTGRIAPQLVLVGIAALCLAAAGPTARWVRTALVVEAPFVLFALLVPFVAAGPRIEVGGVALSLPGLWGAWALITRALVGSLAAVALACSTTPHELVVGLERLRLPAQLVAILSFMVRYLDVVAEQWHRMSIARASRGFSARGPRDWWVVARSLGTLFVACYERGERVHLAMVSRGYRGTLPPLARVGVRPNPWPLALPALAAALVAVATRLV